MERDQAHTYRYNCGFDATGNPDIRCRNLDGGSGGGGGGNVPLGTTEGSDWTAPDFLN